MQKIFILNKSVGKIYVKAFILRGNMRGFKTKSVNTLLPPSFDVYGLCNHATVIYIILSLIAFDDILSVIFHNTFIHKTRMTTSIKAKH